MDTITALGEVYRRGATLVAKGTELIWESNREPTEAEAGWITRHKPELLRELTTVRLDFETAGPLDLTEVGADVYAADPRTLVLMLAWCIGCGDVQIWWPGQPVPNELRDAIADGAVLVSHGPFDRIIWHAKLVPTGWPAVPLERWSDTSARARAYRVPASLEKAAARLSLGYRKDRAGKMLIRRANAAARGEVQPLTPSELDAFAGYAKTDVETLRELDRRLPQLSDLEQAVFLMDAKVNERGLPIDIETVRRLQAVLSDEDARLVDLMQKLCGLRPTQNVKLLTWLQNNAADPPANLKSETLETWLRKDLFGGLERDVIETRQQFANTSGTKLAKMLVATAGDGRSRGCFLWHGAHTGRWSGRIIQPQNLPRTPKGFDVEATLSGLLHESGPARNNGLSVKASVAGCLRAMIRAPTGQELVVVDFAQVESRVLCWVSGQQSMLEAYRRGIDPYIATAEALGSSNRQLGKLMVLAAGFGGGAKMLLAKAPAYGVTFNISEAQAAITVWRAANSQIVAFWDALHEAMRAVVESPVGARRRGHGLVLMHEPDDTLRIQLPSGRSLIYHQPRLDPNEDYGWSFNLTYQQVGHRDWFEKQSWRGLATENVVQGIAYDLMAAAMLRMDATGIEIIGCVHDEVIGLAPTHKAAATLATMKSIMSAPPNWAVDLPLAAEGYHNTRYVKPPKT